MDRYMSMIHVHYRKFGKSLKALEESVNDPTTQSKSLFDILSLLYFFNIMCIIF